MQEENATEKSKTLEARRPQQATPAQSIQGTPEIDVHHFASL